MAWVHAKAARPLSAVRIDGSSNPQSQLRVIDGRNPAWRRRGNVAWVYAKDARHAVDPYDDGVVNFRRLQGARCVCAF